MSGGVLAALDQWCAGSTGVSATPAGLGHGHDAAADGVEDEAVGWGVHGESLDNALLFLITVALDLHTFTPCF